MINNIIGKHKHSGSIIPYITVDGAHKYDPDVIANEFGKFYSNLGSMLASQIKKSDKSIEEYMSKIPRTLHSLALVTLSMELKHGDRLCLLKAWMYYINNKTNASDRWTEVKQQVICIEI